MRLLAPEYIRILEGHIHIVGTGIMTGTDPLCSAGAWGAGRTAETTTRGQEA